MVSACGQIIEPTPEIRIAAVSVETFPAAGKAGQGLFLSVRLANFSDL